MAKREEERSVTYGSGNVFEDIGLENSNDRLAKSKLASAIQSIIEDRKLTQKNAADLMGIDQPKVSKILRGRLNEFSTEWLLARLLRMGFDIVIVIHANGTQTKSEGAINVAIAQ